jgi:hypothetical protein
LASCITPEDAPSPAERTTVVASARLAFSALPGAGAVLTLGEPEMVRAVDGAPNAGYWLVPGRHGGTMAALARILRDGRVATVGHLTAPAADCADAVTGLAASQITRLADDIARRHGGQVVGAPVLVHDGPVGREAWLLTLRRESGETLLVFATSGGTYVRS